MDSTVILFLFVHITVCFSMGVKLGLLYTGKVPRYALILFVAVVAQGIIIIIFNLVFVGLVMPTCVAIIGGFIGILIYNAMNPVKENQTKK